VDRVVEVPKIVEVEKEVVVEKVSCFFVAACWSVRQEAADEYCVSDITFHQVGIVCTLYSCVSGSFKLVYWNLTFARHFLFSLDCLDCFSVSLPVAFLARYQPKVSISVIPWGDLNVPTFSFGTWNRYCY
jgi:hypothetical protein